MPEYLNCNTMTYFIFSIFFLCVKSSYSSPSPIVLWHGMGDTCCFSFSLGYFKIFLQNQLPGVYVYSVMIGNNKIEDFENGYFKNPNQQIEYVCEKLATDPKLSDGFNVIGFSQGSQFLRGVIQRCGHRLPRIKNYISLGGQHQGVFGLPHCDAFRYTCDELRRVLKYFAYLKSVQKSLVQATYWHDPLNELEYKKYSIFLADINNERTINETYKSNLNNLEHFVLVKFNNDTIVQPVETEWFGFYMPGSSQKTMSLQDSDIYMQDRLGLKQMDKDGKLVLLETDGDHLQFTSDWFIQNILNTYLKNE